MTFDIRAQSADILTPVYVYPGDETIDATTYRSIIFSGYITSVATIYGAARGFGLDIDADTFERWKRIGAAAGSLDKLLDRTTDLPSGHQNYSDQLAPTPVASQSVLPVVSLFHNSLSALPAEQQAHLFSSARRIGTYALEKAAACTITDYVAVLKREALQTSALVYESASSDVRAQAAYPIFTDWCKCALELATLIDSSGDLWSDRKRGLTTIDASLKNSAWIAWQARHSLVAVSKSVHRKATLRALAARVHFSKIPTVLLISQT